MACVRGLILLSDGARLLILFVNSTAINGQSPEGSRRHSVINCPIGQVSLPNVDDGIMAWYSAGHPRFYKIVLAPDCSAPFIPAACILVSRPQLRPRLRTGCSRTALIRELPFFTVAVNMSWCRFFYLAGCVRQCFAPASRQRPSAIFEVLEPNRSRRVEAVPTEEDSTAAAAWIRDRNILPRTMAQRARPD